MNHFSKHKEFYKLLVNYGIFWVGIIGGLLSTIFKYLFKFGPNLGLISLSEVAVLALPSFRISIFMGIVYTFLVWEDVKPKGFVGKP
jgi:hypothetical protein